MQIVITGLSTETTTAVQLNSLELTLFKKTVKGSLFASVALGRLG